MYPNLLKNCALVLTLLLIPSIVVAAEKRIPLPACSDELSHELIWSSGRLVTADSPKVRVELATNPIIGDSFCDQMCFDGSRCNVTCKDAPSAPWRRAPADQTADTLHVPVQHC